jgi:hypothetical protein
VGGGPVAANVAVTLFAEFMTTEHTGPLPMQLPDQPVNVPFAAATAVNVTEVPKDVLAVQLVAP